MTIGEIIRRVEPYCPAGTARECVYNIILSQHRMDKEDINDDTEIPDKEAKEIIEFKRGGDITVVVG